RNRQAVRHGLVAEIRRLFHLRRIGGRERLEQEGNDDETHVTSPLSRIERCGLRLSAARGSYNKLRICARVRLSHATSPEKNSSASLHTTFPPTPNSTPSREPNVSPPRSGRTTPASASAPSP